jgi:hypothetical protein
MGIDPNLCPRLIVLLAGALALSSCNVCITTQCRGRPFLPQQPVQIPADSQYPMPISGLDSGPTRKCGIGDLPSPPQAKKAEPPRAFRLTEFYRALAYGFRVARVSREPASPHLVVRYAQT